MRKGVIYMIICNKTLDIYIGSTFKTIEERLKNHVYAYNAYSKQCGKYCSSYDIIKNGDYRILELYSMEIDNDMSVLRKKEGEFQNRIKCVNKNRAGRTRQEYLCTFKDKIREKAKEKTCCTVCNISYPKNNHWNHIQSKKHLNFNQRITP